MIYKWDDSIRKYRGEDGRVIPDSRIRKWIDEMLASLAIPFIARAEALRNNFKPEEFMKWNTQTRIDLTAMNYSMMMIAFGGQAEMDREKWTIAEGIIAFHLGFFDVFSRGVISGQVAMDGHFAVRTSLYALAGHSTYINGVSEREKMAGMTEERRITTSGRPCIDCKTEQAKGWIAIGTGRRIGDSVCLVRCRCFKEYR